MTRLICIIISLQIVLAQVAYAGRYYDEAQKLVTIQQLQLESTTQTLLMNDISYLANQMFMASEPLSESLKTMSGLDRTLGELALGFKQIGDLNSAEVEQIRSDISIQLNRYAELNREYFALTFAPTSIDRQRAGFVELFDRFIESYSYMCEVGRTDLAWITQIPPNLKPDDVKFSIYFETGNANVSKAKSEQYNYVHPDWNRAAQAGAYTFSVTGSMAGTAWINGASAGVWGTAALGAAAVVAVAVIASYLHGISKYNKAMRDMFAAERLKLHKGVTTQQLSSRYQDKCRHLKSVFTEVNASLKKNLGQAPNKLAEKFKDLETRQNQLTENTARLSKLGDKRFNLQLWDAGLCIKTDEYNENKSDDCQVVRGTLHCAQDTCQISSPSKTKLEELAAEENQLFEKTSESALRLTSDALAKFIAIDVPKVVENYNPTVFNQLREARFEALLRLIEILEIRESVPNQELSKELSIFENYQQLKRDLLNVLSETLRANLSSGTFGHAKEEFIKFNIKFTNFYKDYSHVDEVQRLKQSADHLKSFLEKTK